MYHSFEMLPSNMLLFNNYPAKSRGISLTEFAKIRRCSARLSTIIVLLFNKLSTKRILQLQKVCYLMQCV